MKYLRSIVVPTDFSPTGDYAVEYAAEIARAVLAKLVLLHVNSVPEVVFVRGLGQEALERMRSTLRDQARSDLEQRAKSLCAGVDVEIEVRDGEPYTQILEFVAARKVDLIVMGTHGHTGLKHALIGSTAERVVRLAPCPVLTVRGKH